MKRFVLSLLVSSFLLVSGCARNEQAHAPETREAHAATVLLKSLRLPVRRPRTRYHHA